MVTMLPRVLLVEDDAHVRRFVQLALEDLDIALVPCATLAEARRAWSAGPAAMVLTDLTLPDGSGLDLLSGLAGAQAEGPAAACRMVVFSGGVDGAVERQLAALKVWRVLRKPASVGALVGCVSDALASLAVAAGNAGAPPAAPVQDPAVAFFGGDRALYAAYRQACLAQFAHDMAAGDAAMAAADGGAVQRVAHNLKSVLTMLGEADAARLARAAEELAAGGAAGAPLAEAWLRLRQQVAGVVAAG